MQRQKKKNMENKVNSTFRPNQYQQAYFDWIVNGYGNCVIEAYAGTGKTTTILEGLKYIPSSEKVLMVYFNTHNIEDAKNKIEKLKYRNVTVSGFHKIGYRFFCAKSIMPKENKYKYVNYVRQNISELSFDFESVPQNEFDRYLDNINKLIHYGRLNLAQCVDDMIEIEEKYNISIIADESIVALKSMEWGKKHLDEVDYDDMLWIPCENNWTARTIKYDYVIIDEAQDLSRASLELMKKCIKRGGRMVSIGDRNQTIYGFAGACDGVFQALIDMPNTILLSLPISHRCSQSVIKEAQKIVPDIQAKDGAVMGEVKNECSLNEIKVGDLVISRSNAPLVSYMIHCFKKGLPVTPLKSDYKNIFISRIEECCNDVFDVSLDTFIKDGVIPRLYKDLFDTRNQIMETHGLDCRNATLDNRIKEKYDIINSIVAIAQGTNSKRELLAKINKIFGFKSDSEDDGSDCIRVATIHGSKGLEADNVYILNRKGMPSPLATQDWELLQERNMEYIAITRAKYKLGYISEDELEINYKANNISEYLNDMAYIEKMICRLYGGEPKSYINEIQFARAKVDSHKPFHKPDIEPAVVINEPKSDTSISLLDELKSMW